MIPSVDCKGFYYCNYGKVGQFVRCGGGTLFNPSMMICDWDYNVQCECTTEEKAPPIVTSSPTPPVNSNPESTTPKPTIKPTAVATSTQADCPTPPKCPTEEKECGWGIWNMWTCQCDCAEGFCLSANQQVCLLAISQYRT